jgi:hypothetical protein
MAIDKGLYTCGVFIDFSKAFDTVNHKIILSKLSHYGIRGIAYEWFDSYLSGRFQYVDLNGSLSHTINVQCGIPQGQI